MTHTRYTTHARRDGFTLVELLVVIAIIGLLVSIIVPSLNAAMQVARRVTCLTRLNAQLKAVQMYASEQNDAIPVGPDFPLAGPGTPPTNEVASNNIWIGLAQAYNAHGALLEHHLTNEQAMFCPGDDTTDPVEELRKIRTRVADDMAFCSYFYRQLDARQPLDTPSAKLEDLGLNARGEPVAALVTDANSLLDIPGVPKRTNHKAEKVNIGFAAGHAATFDNADRRLTATGGFADMLPAMDGIFEHADTLAD